MKLTQQQLRLVKQAMIEIAHKKVKHYMSDLIYDFEQLDKRNEAEELRGQLIFIVRECGTELGTLEDKWINYYEGNSEVDCWVIDLDKYAELLQDNSRFSALPHYDYLFNHHDHGDYQIFFLQEK